MEVKIVSEKSSVAYPEADYVRVETWCDPHADTVTLATIERVIHKHRDKPSTSSRRIKTLVQRHPMSPDEAVGLARRYAERKQIRLVLTAATEPAPFAE